MLETNVTIDVSGLKCPYHVIMANKVMDKLNIGQILEILVNEPWLQYDISAWIKRTGQEKLLETTCEKGNFRYLVRKIS